MLTDEQIESIVRGIRERWAKLRRDSVQHRLRMQSTVPGDRAARRGGVRDVLRLVSWQQMGKTGGPKAGSVTDPAYLSLISDQGLRTLVITGRPDFGAPDWRGNVPGRPMTDQEISDVVAWLSSQRPPSAADIEAANLVPGGGR